LTSTARLTSFALLLLSLPMLAQDPARLDPRHVQVLLENERVRVLRLSIPAHEKIPPYDLQPSVALFFTNAHLRFTYPGRRPEEEQIAARAVHFSRGAGKRGVENLGDAIVEIAAIEFKNKPAKKPSGFPGDRDPAILDPTQFKQELQNDWCRVLRFHVGPHEAAPMSLHADRVVIALSDENFRLIRPKYGTTIVDARAGEISWRPAELAAIESLSNHVIEEVLIEPKPFALGPYAPKEPVKAPVKRR
jgi:hypothetical protein